MPFGVNSEVACDRDLARIEVVTIAGSGLGKGAAAATA